jgi:anti-sigma regulatory factor (Ser/Thr protein kinase)
LYVASLRLDAVYAAVGLARDFIRRTLTAWQFAEHIDGAELVGSELVTNAVKMSGQAGSRVVGLQLRVVGASLYVEVWDRESGVPVIPEQSLDAEGGRGLFLVEALSARWDVYRPVAGGKVVWSELPLGEEAEEWVLAEAAFGECVVDRARRTVGSRSGS